MKRLSVLRRVCASLMLALAGPAVASDCHDSQIMSPAPFLGNEGEIFKLLDGSLWQVHGAYNYLYEYYPGIVICPGSGKLILKNKNKILDVARIGNSGGEPFDAGAIESTIVSTFEGLNSGNTYRLANGQVWRQVEAWTWVWNWVNPAVIIYAEAGGAKMKVENIEHPVQVQRIK